MLKAVLWDMDGTLIDSEELHWHAWRETMLAEGVKISREQFRSTFGQRNDVIIPSWLGQNTTPNEIQRVGDDKEQNYRQLVRQHGVALTPGATEWVRQLRADGWLQAVASSAPRMNIETVLESLALDRYFDAIVSAEDVSCGKPDPEVFLTAAQRLSTKPPECIVVEDAPAGVEAARRAGMCCVALGSTAKLGAADIVVANLSLLAVDAFDRLLNGLRTAE